MSLPDANHLEFVSQSHGTAMDPLTVTTLPTKKIVARLRVPTTSTNVTTTNASSRLTFVMESINAAMDQTKERNMHV